MIAVQRTVEFDRITALPRRVPTLADAQAWARVFTSEFAVRASDVALRPWQGYALAEAIEHGGAWLALPVGQGKTLLTYTLPTALHAADDSVLIAPAIAKEKTIADFVSYPRDGWRALATPRFVSREELALESREDLLTRLKPRLILVDESDELSNVRRAAAKRVDRYVKRAANDVMVVVMTGSPARKSILEYQHQLHWCLGDGAPVPAGRDEAQLWAAALDFRKWNPVAPGVLGGSLAQAREWYRRRLLETPGVVIIDEDSCDQPLVIRERYAREDPVIDEHYARFLLDFEDPGGTPVTDPLSRWRLDAFMGLGLYRYWDPPPPEEWRSARRVYAKFVRGVIDSTAHTARPLDTEAQVVRRFANRPEVSEWRRIEPTFTGKTRTAWFSRSAIESVQDWLAELDAPGIVWTGCVEFAFELARVTGLVYYGARADTPDALLYRAPKGVSLIASWYANKRIVNMQAWPRQLLTMGPPSSKYREQIYGRSHRAGQDAPVIVDELMTSGGSVDALASAIAEAEGVRKSVSLTQKILRAKIVRASPPRTRTNVYRWATAEDREDLRE